MMLGNLLFHYAANKMLAEDHPTIDFEHCINGQQVKHRCRTCADICSEKVYSGNGSQRADFTKCVNCNLCITACPTRCIASSGRNASKYLKLLKLPEETIYIAHDQYEGDAHLRAEYFASLPWEYLAYLGLRKKVVFLTACPREQPPQVEAVWQETLTRLRLFFGKDEFDKRYVFSEEVNYVDDQEINRRELLKKVSTGVKSWISSFAPSEVMMDGLLYRYLLKETIAEDSPIETFGWSIPIVSSKCKGCGVCTRICPQNAISVRKEDGLFLVVFYPIRCNQCGLCRKTCIHHAIEGFGSIRIDNLKPMILLKKYSE